MIQKIPWERKRTSDFEHVFNENKICIFCAHGKPYADHFKIPCVEKVSNERIETGPIQFGEDWPGIFIRGDNAMHYGFSLKQALEEDKFDPIMKMTLHGLARLLMSCNEFEKESDG